MRKVMIALTIGLILTSVSISQAQDTAAAPAEPVLKHIPAGAVGYVIVNNIQSTIDKVEKFAVEIGVMPAKPDDAPKGSMMLMMLRQMAQLGDGFNPNADAAIVLLDPKQFGFNIPALIDSGMNGKELDEKNAQAIANGVPFAIFVPGNSIKGVFGNYEIETSGKLTTVKLRMGKMFAAQAGSYVVLSPNKDALNAVLTSAKKTDAELTKAQAALIKRNNISYNVDFKIVTPTIQAIMKAASAQIEQDEPEMAGIVKLYFSLFGQLFEQLEAESGGIRIDKTGIIAEALDIAKPKSAMAKTWTIMGAAKTKGASVLNSLPSLPYVLAAGGAGEPGASGSVEMITKLVDDILAVEPLATKLDAATKAKTKKTIAGLMDEIGDVQFVGGGAPAGNGLFGLAWSIKCKDSAKVKALLADKAALAETFIKALIDDREVQQLKITYSKGVETVGQIPVDSIEISHPEMAKMSARERTEMTKVLGEDKIRFLIAAADKNTVVITFAGSTAMTAKAIATAAGKGPIPTAKGTSAAMEALPKDPNALVFINLANLLDVIRTGMAATIDDPEQRQQMTAMIPQLQCKTPIAIGLKAQKNTAHSVMFIPTALVKEIVPKIQQTMMMFMMGAMGGGQPQPAPDGPPPGDF
jgi:hypothetical protein